MKIFYAKISLISALFVSASIINIIPADAGSVDKFIMRRAQEGAERAGAEWLDGYNWAKNNGDINLENCPNHGKNFMAGCEAYISNSTKTGVLKIKIAATDAVKIYKEHGMQGLVYAVNRCYDINKREPYCFYIDVSARCIDKIMTSSHNLPGTSFFSNRLFNRRVHNYFAGSDLSKTEIDKTINYINSVVYAEIERSTK